MQEQQQVMQMQHSMNMNMMSTNYYPNNNLTTHHIQQYLDENKSLILKIVESQNAGKLSECAENQARLQRNLMYLAAIADSQPQPTMHSQQYGQSGMMQSGAHYLQGQQAQQAGRSSMLYTQQQYSALQQQQALHSQLGMGSSGSGTHMLHSEANTSQLRGFPDMRGMTGGGGSKQNSDDGDDNN